MSTQEEWDVEQHKADHECDEHWELRRKFLLAHKDKFPENELVCLAQTFTNIEFLGCKYPNETMQLIAELSQDVAADYREKQKSKLKRTFVKASDAASSKAKGLNQLLTNIVDKKEEIYETITIDDDDDNNVNDDNNGNDDNDDKYDNDDNDEKYDDDNDDDTDDDYYEAPPKKMKIDRGSCPFGNLILVQHPNEYPQSTIQQALSRYKRMELEWKYHKEDHNWVCSVLLNSEVLGQGRDEKQKIAKFKAAEDALLELQKYCYTIKVKDRSSRQTDITAESLQNVSAVDESLPKCNIGTKLMSLMGWEGGGLGKFQQGIKNPIIPQQKVNREGLGLKSNTDLSELKMNCTNILKQYMDTGMMKDLKFSSEFNGNERSVIHEVARSLGLKSQSYGPKSRRSVMITRKFKIHDLVEELKRVGGNSDKYELIEPRGQD